MQHSTQKLRVGITSSVSEIGIENHCERYCEWVVLLASREEVYTSQVEYLHACDWYKYCFGIRSYSLVMFHDALGPRGNYASCMRPGRFGQLLNRTLPVSGPSAGCATCILQNGVRFSHFVRT